MKERMIGIAADRWRECATESQTVGKVLRERFVLLSSAMLHCPFSLPTLPTFIPPLSLFDFSALAAICFVLC